MKLLAETRGSWPRPPAASRSPSLRKLIERGEIGRRTSRRPCITGNGLKTLDATRDRFQMHEIDPISTASIRVRAAGR